MLAPVKPVRVTHNAQTVISAARGNAAYGFAPTTVTATVMIAVLSKELLLQAFADRERRKIALTGVFQMLLIECTRLVATHRRFADVFVGDVVTHEITSHTCR